VLDILIGISRQDYETVARVYYELGIKVPGVRYDYDAFEADVIDVMERHVANKTLSEIDIGAFFGDLVAGAIRHRIKMPPNYTMVFKALITIEGIGKTLAPEVNFIEEAQPFVREVLQDRYSPRRLVKQGVDTLDSLSRFLRAFPDTATQLLQDAQRGELQFKAEIRSLDRLAEAHARSQARLARSIAFAACVLGMALTWEVDAPRVLGMSWVACVLFVGAVLLGIPLVVAFVRSGRRGSPQGSMNRTG
jgi:ubiquinone biosynthesis protein